MSDPLAAAKLKAEKAYNAAADNFDAEPLAFWARYGRRTVERLRLRRGACVLDVCCGTGASALPAAQAVGAAGQVIAVDLAGELLKLGQAKAQAAGLQCVEFRRGDMTGLGFPDRHFDAVVCMFGIFFVPDKGSSGSKPTSSMPSPRSRQVPPNLAREPRPIACAHTWLRRSDAAHRLDRNWWKPRSRSSP